MNASLVSGLNDPYGIAVSGSNLFVANDGTGTIGEYTTSGAVVNASLVSGLSEPDSIAVSGSNLFVANEGNGTIGEYNATSGAVVNASLVSGLNKPYGIAIVDTPEPSTLTLLGVGAMGLIAYFWRRRAKTMVRGLVATTLVTATMCAGEATAQVVLPTLPIGSQYQILSLTKDSTAATSSDINYYNNFVTKEADQDSTLAGLGVSWHAIASTDSVNAITNAPASVGIPIYNTAGSVVFTNAQQPMYATPMLNPVGALFYTQQGFDEGGEARVVWTGCYIDGTVMPFYSLGSGVSETGLDVGMSGLGGNGVDFNWLSGGWMDSNSVCHFSHCRPPSPSPPNPPASPCLVSVLWG